MPHKRPKAKARKLNPTQQRPKVAVTLARRGQLIVPKRKWPKDPA